MPTDVRELRVFMASPSDLTDEREALRNLERRMNAMFRERSVRISIEGWEEVQPEAGRPQAQINPLVHECEIFIGLLNMRWGSPTGTHSSGFEEEFEIALARRKKTETPAIGMFFRKIDPERLADKGPQLTAVLDFQERVHQEQLLLYKTFESADQLSLVMLEFLTPYAMRMADELASRGVDIDTVVTGSTPTIAEPPGLESSGAAEPQAKEHPQTDAQYQELDSAQQQITEALNSFAELFTGGKPLDQTVRDRVTLVGTAFAKDPGLLRTHHVNRLYSQRVDLDLTLGEARTWQKTYFANVGTVDRENRTVPIWGVLEPHDIGPWLIEVFTDTVHDGDVAVARGALRFMTRHAIRPEDLWGKRDDGTDTIESGPEAPSSKNIVGFWVAILNRFAGVDVAVNYLTAVATEDDVPLLSAISDAEQVAAASRLVVDALASTLMGDLGTCERLAPSKYNSEDTEAIQHLLIELMPRLTETQWDAMLTGTHQTVATAAAIQLVEHADVTSTQLKAALALDEGPVYDALVSRASRDSNWATDQIQAVKELNSYASRRLFNRLLAASFSPEALKDLDKEERMDVSYWIARTIQDPEGLKEVARGVLDGTADFLNKRTAPLEDQHAAVADYLTDMAKAAACDVLATIENPDDRDLDRVADELRRHTYISRESALYALIAMVSRCADGVVTLPDLGDLSVLDDYSSVPAIEAIIESPLAGLIAPIWRESDVAALRTAALTYELQNTATEETLEEALYDDDPTVRIVAVDQLFARWNDEQLHDLLAGYHKRDRPYWYNVIAALDEHLYGDSSSAGGTGGGEL